MKPTLMILAAGIGSRYGSLKQMDKFGPSGEAIIEYSIYDAIKAGFGKIVFVIRKEIESDFKAFFEPKLNGKVEIEYVFQELDNVPEGIIVPSERIKPWGTAHAVMVAKNAINEPFAVINADDFYGQDSYRVLADFLKNTEKDSEKYCMVGYKLENTLSDYGTVARGICEADENNLLTSIVERTKIGRNENGEIVNSEENALLHLKPNEITSMNMMGFSPKFLKHCEHYFIHFIEENVNNLKAEFYLPFVVNQLLSNNRSTMSVLHTDAKWFGVTYKEDKEMAIIRINALVNDGIYPNNLWE